MARLGITMVTATTMTLKMSTHAAVHIGGGDFMASIQHRNEAD
jgi:hypothetical protein